MIFAVFFARSQLCNRRIAGPTCWVIVLLVCLSGYRFSQIGSGHFYWGDEARYLAAEALVDDFQIGAYRAGIGHLFEATVRPGFVLVSVIPAVAQRVVGAALSIERDTPRYYDTTAAFNVLVLLGVSLCVFALARRWTSHGWFALLITTLYSLLTCVNVGIRHLTPYYESLLLFLLALLILSSIRHAGRESWSSTKTTQRIIAAGVLSALGWTCYPGYYVFVLINAAVALAVARRRWFVTGVLFAASSSAVLCVFEVLARVAGTSYFQNMLGLPQLHARLMKTGLCAEGHVFAWRYLRDVEGAAGVMLFVLFVGFVGGVVWRRGVGLPLSARVAILTAIGGYLLHATQAVLGHRTVFYGRTFAMYVPFVVFGAGLALMHIRWAKLRAVAVCGVLLVSGWSFVSFARWYHVVQYPEDFFSTTLAQRRLPVCCLPNAMWTDLGAKPARGDGRSFGRTADAPFVAMVADPYPEGFYSYQASHEAARSCGARFIGVNLKWIRNIPEEYERFDVPPGYELIAEAVNPIAHPAVAYEERTWRERELLAERGYTMRIYEKHLTWPKTASTNPRSEHEAVAGGFVSHPSPGTTKVK